MLNPSLFFVNGKKLFRGQAVLCRVGGPEGMCPCFIEEKNYGIKAPDGGENMCLIVIEGEADPETLRERLFSLLTVFYNFNLGERWK